MTLSRRRALLLGGGLVVAFRSRAEEPPRPGSLATTPLLDGWLLVAPDSRVTVFTGKVELGQGLKTALIQVAAEQLDVDPACIELITADTARTPDEGFTAGSHSMQDSGTAILHAAAQARALLVQVAASGFGTRPDALSTANGRVYTADGRSVAYGPLAAQLDLHVLAAPFSVLKDPAAYRLIGTSMPRVDIPAKLTGKAAYIQDLRLPGMLHARVIRQPSKGAKLLDADTSAIERMAGVVKVVRDGSYLAVVAVKEWQAIKAMRALAQAAIWQETATFPDEDTILDHIRELPARDIPIMKVKGEAAPPVRRLQARYTRPYIMHGAIGPSCSVARFDAGALTVWTNAQGVYPLRAALAGLLQLSLDQVRCIHIEGSGCYGHNGSDDAAGDAALIARAVPGRPVRVQWMREQEHTNEPYGPAMISEVEAALDADGRIVDWNYQVWSNSHNRRPIGGGLLLQNAALPEPLPVPPPAPIPMPEGGGERNSNPLYVFPNARVISHFIPRMPLRVSALRSLGAYMNIFAIESFMDELAEAAAIDPVTFRLNHLRDDRAKAVITLAAEAFGRADLTRGTGCGFAFARYKNLGAYCAVAVAMRVDRDTFQPHLGRIVAAVDSGQAINPDGIRNQIEGAIIQAASWTLHESVHFDRTRILSTDWHSYPIMRFPAVPESITVHIVPRPGQPFLGTGEAGQGPAAAAIANAMRDAVGVRLRDVPFTPAKIKAALGL